MDYSATKQLRGNAEKAITFVVTALTPIGFRVVRQSAETVELAGPPYSRTRQSALVGASRLVLHARGESLGLEADLGGVRRLVRFVTIFPLGLCLFLGLVFGAIHFATGRSGAWLPGAVAIGVNVVVWLVVGPLLARWLRNKTRASLDALLENAAAMASR